MVGLTQLLLTVAMVGKPKVEQRCGVVTTRGYAKLNHVDNKGYTLLNPLLLNEMNLAVRIYVICLFKQSIFIEYFHGSTNKCYGDA